MTPTNILIVLVASWLAFGVLEQFHSEFRIMHTILIAIFVYLWVHAHIRSRKEIEPRYYPVLAGFIPIVGLPMYFFKTMERKDAGIATLKAIGVLVVCITLYEIGYQYVRIAI